MSTGNTVLACPICLSTTKSDGSEFSSLWSLTLHVAGKARIPGDLHRSWVYKLVPGADTNSVTINQLGDQIQFYVLEALQELEEKDSIQENLTEQPWDSVDVEIPVARSDYERDHYLTAYRLIWTIETRLHSFVATVLSQCKEGQWWISFPNDLQKKCLERAQQDNHRSPLDRYIDLLDFGSILNITRMSSQMPLGV